MFKTEKLQLLVVALIAAVILFAKLGSGGLASLDDCYYAEQAKEILQTGDWLTMHYQGKPMHENDPVCLWSMALMFKTFGVNEFSARFHSAFFGFLTILLIYFLGRKLYGHWTGIFSSVILLTTQIYTKYARHAMLDVTLTFFVILALYFFVLAIKDEKKQGSYLFLFGISTGIAVLTKNMLGIFPLITAAFYILFNKTFSKNFSLKFVTAALAAVVIPGIWYYYSFQTSGTAFFKTHFGYILFDRSVKEGAGKQTIASYLSYFTELFRFYLPWIFFAIAGYALMVKKWLKEKDKGAILLLLHVTLTMVILSTSNARKIWYIMPVFPAFAIMGSVFANEYLMKTEKVKLVTLYYLFGLGAVISGIILFTPVRLDLNRNADIKALAPYIKEVVPAGTLITTYMTEEHFAVQLPMIFYSDRSIEHTITDKAEMQKLVKGKAQIYGLTYMESFKDLGNVPIIARYGEMVFFTNKPVKDKKLPLFENTGKYEVHR